MQETALIAGLAAIVGACLGAGTTYFIARTNLRKEVSLKMAEYRLQWINNLGDEFAQFLAALAVYIISSDESDITKSYDTAFRSQTKIHLLMNVKDRNYEAIIKKSTELIRYVGSARQISDAKDRAEGFYKLRAEFLSIANTILKDEWKKTKRHLREDTIEVSALRSEPDSYNTPWWVRQNGPFSKSPSEVSDFPSTSPT